MTTPKRMTLSEMTASPTNIKYLKVSVGIDKDDDPKLYALFSNVRGKKREALFQALLLLGFAKEQCDSVDQGENACAAAVENFLDLLRTLDIKDSPDWVKELLAAKPFSKGL